MPPKLNTIGANLVVGDLNTHPFLKPGEPQPILIRRPCIIIEKYTGHSARGFSTISVPLGAKGIVAGVNKNSTFVDVVLLEDQDGVTTHRGWVPSRIVKVGYRAAHGDENTVRRGANLTMLGNLVAVSTNDLFKKSPTCQVLGLFWQGVWRSRKILTCINQKCLDAMEKHGGPDAVTRRVYTDTAKDSPGVIKLLDSGEDCTAKSINAASTAIFKKGFESIYTKGYDKIPRKSKSDKKKIPGYYTGVTRDEHRDTDHENRLKDPHATEYHYRYAHGARDRSFRTMVTFREPELRPLFEQSMICLFDCQAHFIKSALSSVSFALIGEEEGDLATDNLGDLADRKIQGKLFYELMKKAKARVPAFKAGCDNPSFDAVGLNDDTPLTSYEMSEQNFTTKVVIPGQYTEYRRRVKRAAKVGAKEAATFQVNLAGSYSATSGDNQFRISLIKKKDGASVIPPATTDYDIVIQVPENEQQHPQAFSRLPKIGPFKTWKKVTGTLIGIQWTNEKGEHVGVWLQADQVYVPIKDAHNVQQVGAWLNYTKVEALIRSLEQREISHAPSWFSNFHMARILEIDFDYLAQTWIETERFPSGIPSVYVESNWRKDDNAINAELVAVFGRAAVNKADDKPEGKKGSFCGRCYIQRGGSDTGRKTMSSVSPCDWSKKPDGTTNCTNCRLWGTPCIMVDRTTWTKSMRDAVAPPEPEPLTLFKAQDARLILSNSK